MDTQVTDSLLGALVDGRYRVRGQLARGGTATVYLAVDERLERTVALKVIHPAQAGQPALVDQLVNEARAITRLTHPNVVAAFDQGTHGGLPYLVMEYVPSRTLREILDSRQRLSPAEALAIIEQVLAAIAAAHRAGLVHRDIKPENVLVIESPAGTSLIDSVVKVADFGPAQALSAHGESPGLLATAAYVAPELVAEGHADPRSDVYSIGIMLFEMLTGRVPYDTGTPAEIAWQHVDHDVPPPSTYAPELPGVLDHLVARATGRDPAARATDAGALLAEALLVREQVATGAGRQADATMVMRALPADRPAWARLPARSGPGGERTGGWSVTMRSGHATRPWRTPALAAAAALAVLIVLGGWWFGFGRWMPAPDLLAMTQEEAVAEAGRLGLDVRFAEARHSDQVAVGLVLAQDPDYDRRVARGGTITLTLSLGPEDLRVPDVVGADFEVAGRQLADMGLVVREGPPQYSNTVPAGRVLSLEPGVGSQVRPGDEIVVSVSQGRAPIQVPVLLGLHVNEASNELQRHGLQGQVVEVESDRPAGEVVGQAPEPGSGAVSGDTVTLEVSLGPPTVPVPDVMGQRCDRAERALRDAGFEVQMIGLASGQVRIQNPPGDGTGVPPGSQVTIWCL
jgi:serine/threonine-protein kinase